MAVIQTHEPQFTLLEPNYYEVMVTDAKEVPNNFYDPKKPQDGFPTQIEVYFSVDNPADPTAALFLKKWFSPMLSPKSHLTMFLKAVFPKFDPKNPEEGQLDTDKWVSKVVRVNIIQKEE